MTPTAFGEGDLGPGSPCANTTSGLGVVIPTLNEVDYLPALLGDLAGLIPESRVIVVDGGSTDGTLETARREGARGISSPAGRARQMNRGASALSTPWLLFLHADCRIPPETARAIHRWIAAPSRHEAAHFRFALGESRWFGPVLEVGQRVRERLSGLAYGDQGLLVSRTRFDAVGGFPELPLMEDVEMVRRLRRTGGLDRIDAPLPTSTRRYDRAGPILGWFRNALLMGLYLGGVHPDRLARFYGPGAGIR